MRGEFDAALVDRATAAGATLSEAATVLKIAQDGDLVRLPAPRLSGGTWNDAGPQGKPLTRIGPFQGNPHSCSIPPLPLVRGDAGSPDADDRQRTVSLP